MKDSNSLDAISESSDQSESWERIGERHEECLIPLKEDLADWLNKTLGQAHLTADNLMDVLDSGVLICQLARLISDRAVRLDPHFVPPFNFKWWPNARPGSFFARDNAANFLGWCRQLGINEAVLFESESLVLHTRPRTVVLCLLELARIASKFGVEPPGIVKLEDEIDACLKDKGVDVPVERRPKSKRKGKRREMSHTPSTSSSLSELGDESNSNLHAKVLQITDAHCSRSHIRMISDGKYLIAGRIVFVRLLNHRHVMVRVGGGWDTLEHFVARHRRSSSVRSESPETSNDGEQDERAIRAICSSATSPSSPVGVAIF